MVMVVYDVLKRVHIWYKGSNIANISHATLGHANLTSQES